VNYSEALEGAKVSSNVVKVPYVVMYWPALGEWDKCPLDIFVMLAGRSNLCALVYPDGVVVEREFDVKELVA